MKNKLKILGIIALLAVVGLLMAGCDLDSLFTHTPGHLKIRQIIK